MNRYIPNKKNNRQRRNVGVRPGVYKGVVTSVVSASGFTSGHAIDVNYAVSIGNSSVSYTERFFISNRNSVRTKELEDFLDAISADTYDEIVGLEFELTFAYEVSGGRSWCNIVCRRLLTEVEGYDSNC